MKGGTSATAAAQAAATTIAQAVAVAVASATAKVTTSGQLIVDIDASLCKASSIHRNADNTVLLHAVCLLCNQSASSLINERILLLVLSLVCLALANADNTMCHRSRLLWQC